jgi:hypothetical protein
VGISAVAFYSPFDNMAGRRMVSTRRRYDRDSRYILHFQYDTNNVIMKSVLSCYLEIPNNKIDELRRPPTKHVTPIRTI